MARSDIRRMKRCVEAGRRVDARADATTLAALAALSLLARSITFGHKRLALIRLEIATRAGADIPPASWLYCREVASHSRDKRLRSLFIEAAGASHCTGADGLPLPIS
ncbi:MAG: hypothetical protein ABI887_13960 [Burkholderiales bacterium]